MLVQRGAPRAGLVVVLLWLAWYRLVLVRASKTAEHWGPRWLARAASGMLNRCGCWWLKHTHNKEEVIAKGILSPEKQYVMPLHPHGAFTVAALYFASNWCAADGMGGMSVFVIVAPLLLRIPILSEYLLWCNARDQGYSTFDKLLSRGHTVSVLPGGIAEQVATDATQEQLFFPGKLGFVRLAMKHGVPLLPTYAFGENQLFPTSRWMKRINDWFYRNLKTGNLLVHGLGGIPNSPILPNPLMMPTPGKGLHIRIGNPVEVGPPNENPTDEEVRAVFDRYMDEMWRLFDRFKGECLPPKVAAKGLHVTLRSKDGPEIISRM